MSGGGVGLRGSRRFVRAPSARPSLWEHVVEAHYGLNAEIQMLWQGAAAANLACQYASWSPTGEALDHVRESVKHLEKRERTARRVLGLPSSCQRLF